MSELIIILKRATLNIIYSSFIQKSIINDLNNIIKNKKRINFKIFLSKFFFFLFLFIFYNQINYLKLLINQNNISRKNLSNDKNNHTDNFFFLSKNEKLKNCKEYGIFIYNYPIDEPASPYGNIGDYIQSLAALQFLPKNCIPIFIDRDNIENYNGENINIIMNAWYRIAKGNRFTSSNLSPIYISIHISNPFNLDNIVIRPFSFSLLLINNKYN